MDNSKFIFNWNKMKTNNFKIENFNLSDIVFSDVIYIIYSLEINSNIKLKSKKNG